MEVRVYTPRRGESFFRLFKEIISGFKNGRELAWRLFVRDLTASYRKSLLGFLWVFIPPLATAAIWIFLASQRVVVFSETPMKYAGFTLCGTLLWSLFAEAIVKPMTRYLAAMGMMNKLNFPREAIILASVYDLVFALLLRLIILIPALWYLGYPPTLFFIPGVLAFMGLMMIGLSIGIFLTPLGLLFNDINRGLPLVLPFIMYLTPVIYPLRSTGIFVWAQRFNPATPFLERARSLFGNYAFNLSSELWWWSGIILLFTVAGLIILKVALPVIVERSGN